MDRQMDEWMKRGMGGLTDGQNEAVKGGQMERDTLQRELIISRHILVKRADRHQRGFLSHVSQTDSQGWSCVQIHLSTANINL